MILTISLIITLAAAVQWIIIRNVPFRLVRIVLQVPLLIITFFVAWLIGLYLNFENLNQQQDEFASQIVDQMLVIRGDLRVTVDGTGAVTPIQQVPLSFQLPSLPVQEVYVEQGQRVAAGDLLATLDAADLEQGVENAQLTVRLQQSLFDALTREPRPEDLAVAQAAIDSAQAQLNAAVQSGTSPQDVEIARLQSEIARNQLWQTQLSRDALSLPEAAAVDFGVIDVDDSLPDDVEESLEQGVQDLQALLQVQAAAQNAAARQAYEAQLRQANSSIEQVEYGVDIADANLEAAQGRSADAGSVAAANAARTQAQIAYDRLINGPSTLELQQAALDLRLAELSAEQAAVNKEQATLTAPFAGLIAQQNLVTDELPPQGLGILLIDDSQYIVELPIDETDIPRVQTGQAVEFQVDALPDALLTGVVESIAYTPLESGQLVAYNVRVALDPTGAEIRPGMTVTGSIIVQERLAVPLVRNSFIRIDRVSGDAFVHVRESDGTIQERLILLGERNESFTEILSGLEVGDEVVLLPRNDSLLGT